jgi:hypothetical protein
MRRKFRDGKVKSWKSGRGIEANKGTQSFAEFCTEFHRACLTAKAGLFRGNNFTQRRNEKRNGRSEKKKFSDNCGDD